MISLKDSLLHTQSDESKDIRYSHSEVQTGLKVYVYEASDFALEFKVRLKLYNTYTVRITLIRNGQRYTHGTSCEIYVKTDFEAIRLAIKEVLIELG